MSKFKEWLKTEHVEVTLRLSLSIFLGYVLTFASSTSSIFPPETKLLFGVLVPFCSMSFPTLAFTFAAVILPLFSVFLFIQVIATILATVTVVGGYDAFIAAFAFFVFCITFFRFIKTEGNKCSIILIGIVFQTILTWPNVVTIRNGFSYPNKFLPPQIQTLLGDMLEDTVQAAKDMGQGKHSINVISGVLKDHIVDVTIANDGSSETYFSGGMWLVRETWNLSSGIQNPFAKCGNILLTSLWIILILAVAVLLPPIRTMRTAVWRGIIPAALLDASSIIRSYAATMDKEKSDDVASRNDEELDSGSNGNARYKIRGKCVYHINTLFAGNLAKLTALEPRIFVCKPGQRTTAILFQLSEVTSKCVRIALGIEPLTEREKEFLSDENAHQYLEVADTLEKCAKALAYCDISILETDDIITENMEDDDENGATYDPFHFQKHASDVVLFSKKWLNAMSIEPPTESTYSLAIFFESIKPFVLVQVSHFLNLGSLLMKVFQKTTWTGLSKSHSLPRLVWCLKYTVGMTMLTGGFFWDTYREGFVICSKDDPLRLVFASQNAAWCCIAFCFATTQTVEGSIKKGILRMIGTIIGALSAWLALLACETGRYTNRYNPYGIITWLTVTTILSVYVSTERGFAARVSLSNDYGFGPLYFVVTQVIIVSYGYYYYDPESIPVLVVNRMVSNLVGIALSMLLALIPPTIKGSDPSHCESIVTFHRNSVAEVLNILLSCHLDPENGNVKGIEGARSKLKILSSKILVQGTHMQEMAVDFEKDASKLRKVPIFLVDPLLKPEISKVTRDIYICAFIAKHASDILADGETRSILLNDGSYGRYELENLNRILQLRNLPLSTKNDEGSITFDHQSTRTNGLIDAKLLIYTIKWLLNEIHGHEEVLCKIRKKKK